MKMRTVFLFVTSVFLAVVVAQTVAPPVAVVRDVIPSEPKSGACSVTDSSSIFMRNFKIYVCMPDGEGWSWRVITTESTAPAVEPPPVTPPPPPVVPLVTYSLIVYVYPVGAGTVTVAPALSSVADVGYAGSFRGLASAGATTLTAVPAQGYRFVGWPVLNSTSNPLSIFMARALMLQANFEKVH